MAEELVPWQYTGKEEHSDRSGKARQKLRIRDVAKVRSKNNQYAILGIENQDELHYYMPFRCMEYETEDYAKQIRRLKQEHELIGDLESGAEFLSGVKEKDKLKPVVTFVFYHGKGVWNTCRELHDMIDFSGENEIMKKYTSNYRTNIISLQDIDENKFQTGLREVIGMMRRRNDKNEMRRFFLENEDRFQNMDANTYDTINVMTDWKKLQENKRNNVTKEGNLDMCKAIEEWEKELLEEGEKKFALLVGKLLADGRIEDLQIASVNEENRKVLYEEYGLTRV